MAAQFARAPHRGVTSGPTPSAPNAALLIDFDNVTMGIRSDLSKELKNLLNSDIIKGKVAVQRAYADWRRYPQYIVPLAEASVDLIFAPAYGSSKKNATDIRLAIDALELVFTRPEIGTFILLSGDSDFSSLVLKLKEYGKYVIGVGIRESASDLLVQNCDEYYSYSVLTGLTKEDDTTREALDPWMLVEKAVKQMAENGDIMRSDRLKQVMLELDPNFSEKELGYSKFSKFLSDAVARGCLALKKGENGQWEVAPAEPGVAVAEEAPEAKPEREARTAREDGRRSRGRGRGRGAAAAEAAVAEPAAPAIEPVAPAGEVEPVGLVAAEGDPLAAAYALLRRAVESVTKGGAPARDSDVKRRMLELDPSWDESTVGFSKFSRFLRQAHDAEVIDLHKTGNGAYEVTLAGGKSGRAGAARPDSRGERGRRGATEAPAESRGAAAARADEAPKAEPAAEAAPRGESRADTAPEGGRGPELAKDEARAAEPKAAEPEATSAAAPAGTPSAPAAPTVRRPVGVGIGFRPGMRRGGVVSGPPPLLPGQTVRPKGSLNGKTGSAEPESAEPSAAAAEAAATAGAEPAKKAAAKKGQAKSKKAAESKQKPTEAKKQPAETTEAAAPAKEKAAGQSTKKAGAAVAPELVGLPTDAEGVVAYLTTRYKGVGAKTAEALIAEFGADGVFRALHADPARVRELLGARRAEALLKGWESDLAQRRAEAAAEVAAVGTTKEAGRSSGAATKKSAEPKAQAKPSEASGSKKSRGAARKSGSAKGKAAEAETPKAEPVADAASDTPAAKQAAAAEPEGAAAPHASAAADGEAAAPKKSRGSRSRGRRGGRKRGKKVEAGGD